MKLHLTKSVLKSDSADCALCLKPGLSGQVVASGWNSMKGTLLFHKQCMIDAAVQAWPEDELARVQREILENPEDFL